MHLRDGTDAPDFLLSQVLTLEDPPYRVQVPLVLLAEGRMLGRHLGELGG
jgi:hypothetical protein